MAHVNMCSRFLFTQLTNCLFLCKFYRLRCLSNICQRALGLAIICFVFSIFLFSRAQAALTVCFGSIKLEIHQQQSKLKTYLCKPTLSEMAAGKSLKIPFISLNRKIHDGRLFICIFQKIRGGGWEDLWTPCILCSVLPILDKHQEQTRPCPLQNSVTQSSMSNEPQLTL